MRLVMSSHPWELTGGSYHPAPGTAIASRQTEIFLASERTRVRHEARFADKPAGITAPLALHRETLLAAGFRTADEVWRHHADAILIGVR
jgi:hypothetical protein